LSQGEARVWNASTGKALGPPVAHRDGILCAAFCADGRRLVTGSEDFTSVVWDVSTGQAITPPMRHRDQVRGVAFSPNGRWIATVAADGVARVWDAVSGEPLTPPLLHPNGLQSVGFSADGSRLITADTKARLWCWDLHPDSRPIEDLLLLSQLLTGFQSSASKSPNAPKPEERQSAWRKLRAAYSNDFATSREEVFDWHSGCARSSQSEGRWAAAVFHLRHLVSLDPEAAALTEELKQAREHLSKEESR